MEERTGSYIEPKKLREGVLYQIVARNATVGIFRKRVNGMDGFEVARNKFGYIHDFEYEWEQHEKLGTAYAVREIEKAPNYRSVEKKLRYLLEQELKSAETRLEARKKELDFLTRELNWLSDSVESLKSAIE